EQVGTPAGPGVGFPLCRRLVKIQDLSPVRTQGRGQGLRDSRRREPAGRAVEHAYGRSRSSMSRSGSIAVSWCTGTSRLRSDLLIASRAASFTLPHAFSVLPFTCCAPPSTCDCVSPVHSPTWRL